MSSVRNFAWPVTIMQYEDYIALKDCIDKYKEVFDNKKIIIFGAGIRGSIFCKLMNEFGYTKICFCDNNPDKWGGYVNEYKIHSPELICDRDNTIVIISIENGFEIEEQLEKKGYIKNKSYFNIESPIYSLYIKEFYRMDLIDILFIGDCGLSQISISDNKHKALGDMIKEHLGCKRTKVLAMHGMGMRAYYNILLSQFRLGLNPKVVVLTVNFEAFTGKHHLLPRTQHVELFNRILEKQPKPHINLIKYQKIIKERFDNFKLDVSSSYEGNHLENNRRLILRMNYMYKIKKDTEDMKYLLRIIELCNKKDVNIIPFIPPVNYEYANQCIGERFKLVYDNNCDKIKKWISELGVKVLDLSYILGADYFADSKTIDETANAKGREIILEHFLNILN